MGPTWDPAGSCRSQMGPILTPWTLLSGLSHAGAWWWLVRFGAGVSTGTLVTKIIFFIKWSKGDNGDISWASGASEEERKTISTEETLMEACSVPNHYLDQCLIIANWTPENNGIRLIIQALIDEWNLFENVAFKTVPLCFIPNVLSDGVYMLKSMITHICDVGNYDLIRKHQNNYSLEVGNYLNTCSKIINQRPLFH